MFTHLQADLFQASVTFLSVYQCFALSEGKCCVLPAHFAKTFSLVSNRGNGHWSHSPCYCPIVFAPISRISPYYDSDYITFKF